MDSSIIFESQCVCHYYKCDQNQKILPQNNILRHKNHVDKIISYNDFPGAVSKIYSSIQTHVDANPKMNLLEQEIEEKIKNFKLRIDSLVIQLSQIIHKNLDQLKTFDTQRNRFFESHNNVQNLNYSEEDVEIIQDYFSDELLNVRISTWETAWKEVTDLNNKAMVTLQEILAKLEQSVRILGTGQISILKSNIVDILQTRNLTEALDLNQYGLIGTVISSYNTEKTEGSVVFYDNKFEKIQEIKDVFLNLTFIKGRSDLIMFDYLKKEFVAYCQGQNGWTKERSFSKIPNFKSFSSVNIIDQSQTIVFTYTCDKGYDYIKCLDLANGIDMKIDDFKTKRICIHPTRFCNFRIDENQEFISVSVSSNFSLNTFQLYPFKLHQEKIQGFKFLKFEFLITYDQKGLFKIWRVENFVKFIIEKKEYQAVAKYAILEKPLEVLVVETYVIIKTSKYIYILNLDEVENKLISLGKHKYIEMESISAMKIKNGIRIIYSYQNQSQVVDFSCEELLKNYLC